MEAVEQKAASRRIENKEIFEIGERVNTFFSSTAERCNKVDRLFEDDNPGDDIRTFLSEYENFRLIADSSYLSSLERSFPEDFAKQSREIVDYKIRLEMALQRGAKRFKDVLNTGISGDSLQETVNCHQQVMRTLEQFVQLYEHEALRDVVPKAIRSFAEKKSERSANAEARFKALEKLKDDYISGAWKISGGVLNLINATRKAGEQNALEAIASKIEKTILDSCTTDCSPILSSDYADLVDDIRDFIDNYDAMCAEEQKILERTERIAKAASSISITPYDELVKRVDEASVMIMSRGSPSNLYLSRLFGDMKTSATEFHSEAEFAVNKGRMEFEQEIEKLLKSLSYRSNDLHEDEQLARGCGEELGRIKVKYKGLYTEGELLPAESKRKAIFHNCAAARVLIDSVEREKKTLESAVSGKDRKAIEAALNLTGDFFGQRHNVYAKEAISRYLGVVRTAEKMLKDDSNKTAAGLRSEIAGLKSEVQGLSAEKAKIAEERAKYESLAKELKDNLEGKMHDSESYKTDAESEKKRISDDFRQYRQGSERERKELSDRLEQQTRDADQREKALQSRLKEKEEEITSYKRQLAQKNSDDLSSKGKKELKARIAELEGEVAEVKEEYLNLKQAYDDLHGKKAEDERRVKNYEVPLQEIIQISDIPPKSSEDRCLFVFGDFIQGVSVNNGNLYEIKAIALGQRGHKLWDDKLRAINQVELPELTNVSSEDKEFLRKFDEQLIRAAKEGNIMRCIAYGNLSLDLVNLTLSRIRNYLKSAS